MSNLEKTAECGLGLLGLSTLFPKYATRVREPKPNQEPWRIRQLFPGYAFVSFDVDADPWHRITDIPGIHRLFRRAVQTPSPLPTGFVENLMARADKKDVIYPEEASGIARDTVCRVVTPPYEGIVGVCLWSEGDRLKLLSSMLGGKATLDLRVHDVEIVSC
jgi:transcription antitermination factor NusG